MAGEDDSAMQSAEISDVPQHWNVAPLCAFVTRVTYGFTIPMPTTDAGPFMVTAKDIHSGRIDYTTARHTSWGAYHNDLTDKSRPRINDVLLTKDGSIGRVAICDRPDICINQSVALIQPSGEIDSRFLKYLLETPHYQQRMEGDSDGTTIKHIYITRVDKMEVAVPPLPEQLAIARILGTLDDKIDLNRRMKETLDAMARALFRSWFVDFDPVRAKAEGRDPGLPKPLADLFPARLVESELGEIPEGWDVGPLGQFFAVGLGGAWGEDEESARATVAARCLRGIDCHDLAEGRIPDVPLRWVTAKQAADRRLADGTVLMEGSGSFCGRSMIWREAYRDLFEHPVGYSNFCKRLDPICTPTQATICWMQIRRAYQDGVLQSFRTGTAFPNFDVHGALSNLMVAVPPASVADAFGKVFKLSQRLDLMTQSRTLAALRDTLLPKLISGAVRLEDTERFIGNAKP